MTELTARELLIMLYETALDSVDGRYRVNLWCQQENRPAFTHCIAIGKAAAAMTQGAVESIPSIKESLLICPPSKISRSLKKNKKIHCVASSHPIPDERSIEAGNILLQFLSARKPDDKLLFLISGGTSSLVEVPVDGIDLEQLQKINRYLISSGKDIQQINSWRKRFSKIKGGGLLNWLKSVSVTQLLLSDVKGDKKEFIGSGLLINSNETPEDDVFLSAFDINYESKITPPAVRVETEIIGNIKLAMQAVENAAISEGLPVFIHHSFLEGDACVTANALFTQLNEANSGIHIWGGETTVSLPDNPGVGGRNLTLALCFAQNLIDVPNLHFLAAGTDGVDGNSNCAGGIVSNYTMQKAMKMGFDVEFEIEKANAGIVLMATDDLVQAANSNTNVMDIVIAYKYA